MKLFNTLLFVFVAIGNLQAQTYKTGPEEKDFVAYLFTYFVGGDKGEAIRFAVSNDGYNYKALNNNSPVLDSKQISSTGGVRDPHILRTEDGTSFYMIATDMMASKGWDSNRAMVLLKSDDLTTWSSSIVNIQQKFKGQDSLMRVWAPQTIYDPASGKYMIYWSMKHGSKGKDIIYYSYANKDFTDIVDEPKVLFIPKNGLSCIDGDIILKDGVYHLFYKTEGHGNGIKVATSSSLTGTWIEQADYKQQTKQAVEGSSIFKLANENKYILHYDVYRDRTYQFTESSDLENFKVIDHEISMDFKPRHGYIIPITRNELNSLTSKWGKPQGIHHVTDQNPTLLGYYADPEVMYAKKTKKYYIYPTSDGFHEWSGDYFKTFSSDNLTDWKDEGVILDLKKDVSWAKENAWAPTIIEKRNWLGKYKYYYYFTAGKKIGIAISKNPTGPFKDSGKPIIDFKPEGINRGQEIDPDVFQDPKSGKYYFYWGNGYLAVAELEKDMLSIKKSTLKIITPPKTFREGAEVFYRNGKYYFLWSENDTRDENYRVRYAYSDSPTGPLTIPQDNLILTKDPKKGIYGTGHNAVLKVNNKDEWYIVYHRFNRPSGIQMGRAAGYHREVCMDRLEFTPEGTLKIVVPTL